MRWITARPADQLGDVPRNDLLTHRGFQRVPEDSVDRLDAGYVQTEKTDSGVNTLTTVALTPTAGPRWSAPPPCCGNCSTPPGQHSSEQAPIRDGPLSVRVRPSSFERDCDPAGYRLSATIPRRFLRRLRRALAASGMRRPGSDRYPSCLDGTYDPACADLRLYRARPPAASVTSGIHKVTNGMPVRLAGVPVLP